MKTLKILAMAALLPMASPALAHHSNVVYDLENNVQIDGTIVALAWQNPHAWLSVEVTTADGSTEVWQLEMQSIPRLRRNGLVSTSFPVGAEVSATVNPLRDGSTGGRAEAMTVNGVEVDPQ